LPFGIFYCHLVYFIAIWYILWPFGIFYGHLLQFIAISWPFGMLYQEKSGNPGSVTFKSNFCLRVPKCPTPCYLFCAAEKIFGSGLPDFCCTACQNG
jgi:hypothetical protein